MSGRGLLAFALLGAGLALVVVAVIYFVVPAADLPSILGRLEGNDVHRTKRGAAALVLGVVLLYLGMLRIRRGTRPPA